MVERETDGKDDRQTEREKEGRQRERGRKLDRDGEKGMQRGE